MQFEESVPWIRASAFTIDHHLGIDGISLWLVALTAFLTPLALLASWHSITRASDLSWPACFFSKQA